MYNISVFSRCSQCYFAFETPDQLRKTGLSPSELVTNTYVRTTV
jgi:hypothetical protein